MSTIAIVIIAVVVVAIVAFALLAGRRRKHAQLRQTVSEHSGEAQRHAQRANELDAAAAEAREREREHAHAAADAEQRLPDND
jgi:FtsZ-interacting cell division protein ZipA